MTRNFEEAYNKTAKREGYYANNPDDKGGETYCGIARKFHQDWKGWKHIDWWKTRFGTPKWNQRFAKLDDEVKLFYYNAFWNNLRLNEIPLDLAKMIYDVAVNMGIYKAIEFTQRALNVANIKEKLWEDLKVDGIIGSKTIRITQTVNSNYSNKWHEIKIWYICMKGYRYIDIMEKNETQEIFASSWVSRVKFEEKG